jgi:hypothetical protein
MDKQLMFNNMWDTRTILRSKDWENWRILPVSNIVVYGGSVRNDIYYATERLSTCSELFDKHVDRWVDFMDKMEE